MKVDIDIPKNSRIVKKYPKVLNDLRMKIRSGYFTGMLPGVQKLASDFDVNFMTVNKAINMLVDENLLYRIPNKGTFVRKTYRVALAFLCSKECRNQRRQTVYDDLIHGVEDALNKKDMTMIFKNIDPESELLSLKNIENDSDGLILLGDIDNLVKKTPLFDVPVVRVMGTVEEQDTLDHVTFNNYSIGQLAAKHMLSKGHMNCAFICSSPRFLLLERGRAFCETFTKAGGQVRTFISDDLDKVKGITDIKMKLSRNFNESPVPTGIFIPAAWMMGDVYSLFKDMGIIHGKDIEIVTCDKEMMELSKLTPMPDYVDIHADIIGRKAVEILLKRIESPDSQQEKVLLEPDLIENAANVNFSQTA